MKNEEGCRQWVANFYCKGIDSKYSRYRRLCDYCHKVLNSAAIPQKQPQTDNR